MEVRKVAEFRKTVWDFYRKHGRHDLPWRQPEADGSFDPYKILVSEVMLQQTQVGRVISKYEEFLRRFPGVENLANASLGEALSTWNGLGYNRRAKFLWLTAQMIEQNFAGTFPRTVNELQKLPGVGPNTAAATIVYSFNRPEIFVETNVRTVFIHHFFEDQTDVSDGAIRKPVGETLDRKNPRIWFWALMDYGTYLKKTAGNINRFAKNYSKQSAFAGSRRQLRGQIIRQLLGGAASKASLSISDERLDAVLAELMREGLIERHGKIYSIFR